MAGAGGSLKKSMPLTRFVQILGIKMVKVIVRYGQGVVYMRRTTKTEE